MSDQKGKQTSEKIRTIELADKLRIRLGLTSDSSSSGLPRPNMIDDTPLFLAMTS